MTATLDKATIILREEGPINLLKHSIQFGYDSWIRPLLPKRIVSYNDIQVRASRIGDSIIPWHTRDVPGYEDALIDGIRQYVEVGDRVAVVGGGLGVSTVEAATQTTDDGLVITFEGGAKAVDKVKDTVQLNSVDDHVSVRHAIVGRAVSLRGDSNNAQMVQPADLPDCDVLVLDCEGAEIEILEEMDIRPETVLVETHGMFNAPETEVRDRLDRAGYETVKSKVAENRLRDICEENGIYVLFSIHREDASSGKIPS